MTEFSQFELAGDPPRRDPKWQEEADRLRLEHPGEWARIQEFNDAEKAWQTVSRIHQGRYQAFRPATEWEALSRDGWLYVRYVGQVEGVA